MAALDDDGGRSEAATVVPPPGPPAPPAPVASTTPDLSALIAPFLPKHVREQDFPLDGAGLFGSVRDAAVSEAAAAAAGRGARSAGGPSAAALPSGPPALFPRIDLVPYVAVGILDISGYSALTSMLANAFPSKAGAGAGLGAELLTRLLNPYMARMIDTVLLYGGDVIKFAGDAIIVVWRPLPGDRARVARVLGSLSEAGAPPGEADIDAGLRALVTLRACQASISLLEELGDYKIDLPPGVVAASQPSSSGSLAAGLPGPAGGPGPGHPAGPGPSAPGGGSGIGGGIGGGGGGGGGGPSSRTGSSISLPPTPGAGGAPAPAPAPGHLFQRSASGAGVPRPLASRASSASSDLVELAAAGPAGRLGPVLSVNTGLGPGLGGPLSPGSGLLATPGTGHPPMTPGPGGLLQPRPSLAGAPGVGVGSLPAMSPVSGPGAGGSGPGAVLAAPTPRPQATLSMHIGVAFGSVFDVHVGQISRLAGQRGAGPGGSAGAGVSRQASMAGAPGPGSSGPGSRGPSPQAEAGAGGEPAPGPGPAAASLHGRLEYFVAGVPMFRAGGALEAAARGEFAIDQAAARVVADFAGVLARAADSPLAALDTLDLELEVDRMEAGEPTDVGGPFAVVSGLIASASVRDMLPAQPPGDALAPAVPRPVRLTDVHSLFINESALFRLRHGRGGLLNELRTVSVVFVSLDLSPPEVDEATGREVVPGSTEDFLQTAQRTLSTSMRAIREYEGTLRQMMMDDKGFTVLAVFGLPPWSHQHDPVLAVRAALKIERHLSHRGIKSSIGVATGTVYTGTVGTDILGKTPAEPTADPADRSARGHLSSSSALGRRASTAPGAAAPPPPRSTPPRPGLLASSAGGRCDHTILGDCVNMAARLMCHPLMGENSLLEEGPAPGNFVLPRVLCDRTTFAACQSYASDSTALAAAGPAGAGAGLSAAMLADQCGFAFGPARDIRVKGKDVPIQVFRILPPSAVDHPYYREALDSAAAANAAAAAAAAAATITPEAGATAAAAAPAGAATSTAPFTPSTSSLVGVCSTDALAGMGADDSPRGGPPGEPPSSLPVLGVAEFPPGDDAQGSASSLASASSMSLGPGAFGLAAGPNGESPLGRKYSTATGVRHGSIAPDQRLLVHFPSSASLASVIQGQGALAGEGGPGAGLGSPGPGSGMMLLGPGPGGGGGGGGGSSSNNSNSSNSSLSGPGRGGGSSSTLAAGPVNRATSIRGRPPGLVSTKVSSSASLLPAAPGAGTGPGISGAPVDPSVLRAISSSALLKNPPPGPDVAPATVTDMLAATDSQPNHFVVGRYYEDCLSRQLINSAVRSVPFLRPDLKVPAPGPAMVSCRALIVEGETGSGKTTLARLFSWNAQAAGCLVLHVRPSEASPKSPLFSARALLRSLVAHVLEKTANYYEIEAPPGDMAEPPASPGIVSSFGLGLGQRLLLPASPGPLSPPVGAPPGPHSRSASAVSGRSIGPDAEGAVASASTDGDGPRGVGMPASAPGLLAQRSQTALVLTALPPARQLGPPAGPAPGAPGPAAPAPAPAPAPGGPYSRPPITRGHTVSSLFGSTDTGILEAILLPQMGGRAPAAAAPALAAVGPSPSEGSLLRPAPPSPFASRPASEMSLDVSHGGASPGPRSGHPLPFRRGITISALIPAAEDQGPVGGPPVAGPAAAAAAAAIMRRQASTVSTFGLAGAGAGAGASPGGPLRPAGPAPRMGAHTRTGSFAAFAAVAAPGAGTGHSPSSSSAGARGHGVLIGSASGPVGIHPSASATVGFAPAGALPTAPGSRRASDAEGPGHGPVGAPAGALPTPPGSRRASDAEGPARVPSSNPGSRRASDAEGPQGPGRVAVASPLALSPLVSISELTADELQELAASQTGMFSGVPLRGPALARRLSIDSFATFDTLDTMFNESSLREAERLRLCVYRLFGAESLLSAEPVLPVHGSSASHRSHRSTRSLGIRQAAPSGQATGMVGLLSATEQRRLITELENLSHHLGLILFPSRSAKTPIGASSASLARILARLSLFEPVAIIVDDAQWLDDHTSRALALLANMTAPVDPSGPGAPGPGESLNADSLHRTGGVLIFSFVPCLNNHTGTADSSDVSGIPCAAHLMQPAGPADAPATEQRDFRLQDDMAGVPSLRVSIPSLQRQECDMLIVRCYGRGVRTIQDRLSLEIFARTRGHPSFTEAIGYALRDSDVVDVVGSVLRFRHAAAGASLLADTLPLDVETSLLVQYDSLNHMFQTILRVASIFAHQEPFSSYDLAAVMARLALRPKTPNPYLSLLCSDVEELDAGLPRGFPALRALAADEVARAADLDSACLDLVALRLVSLAVCYNGLGFLTILGLPSAVAPAAGPASPADVPEAGPCPPAAEDRVARVDSFSRCKLSFRTSSHAACVYGVMLFELRAEIHLAAAEYYERRLTENSRFAHAPIVAFHYMRTDLAPKKIEYLEIVSFFLADIHCMSEAALGLAQLCEIATIPPAADTDAKVPTFLVSPARIHSWMAKRVSALEGAGDLYRALAEAGLLLHYLGYAPPQVSSSAELASRVFFQERVLLLSLARLLDRSPEAFASVTGPAAPRRRGLARLLDFLRRPFGPGRRGTASGPGRPGRPGTPGPSAPGSASSSTPPSASSSFFSSDLFADTGTDSLGSLGSLEALGGGGGGGGSGSDLSPLLLSDRDARSLAAQVLLHSSHLLYQLGLFVDAADALLRSAFLCLGLPLVEAADLRSMTADAFAQRHRARECGLDAWPVVLSGLAVAWQSASREEIACAASDRAEMLLLRSPPASEAELAAHLALRELLRFDLDRAFGYLRASQFCAIDTAQRGVAARSRFHAMLLTLVAGHHHSRQKIGLHHGNSFATVGGMEAPAGAGDETPVPGMAAPSMGLVVELALEECLASDDIRSAIDLCAFSMVSALLLRRSAETDAWFVRFAELLRSTNPQHDTADGMVALQQSDFSVQPDTLGLSVPLYVVHLLDMDSDHSMLSRSFRAVSCALVFISKKTYEIAIYCMHRALFYLSDYFLTRTELAGPFAVVPDITLLVTMWLASLATAQLAVGHSCQRIVKASLRGHLVTMAGALNTLNLCLGESGGTLALASLAATRAAHLLLAGRRTKARKALLAVLRSQFGLRKRSGWGAGRAQAAAADPAFDHVDQGPPSPEQVRPGTPTSEVERRLVQLLATLGP
ncbi:hypothetical protein H696_05724 [Fonticula alba]|uniref:Guanylate cyclase domain-containing protein n=1 Tax=Fonticula alba TaxID=691883 RepID=A0A058Z1G9_FONAL|nr:hypothetical protein H696_05724 [Fonticula alba]KCV67783.1 hypothetical protein H696_05724 [Fonticula alba]|eukprot:XP_009497814.1 hypothetical protein H696_05724 [Fonticula alba]